MIIYLMRFHIVAYTVGAECHSVTFREQFLLYVNFRRLFSSCYLQCYALNVLSVIFYIKKWHYGFLPISLLLLEFRLLSKQLCLLHGHIIWRRSFTLLIQNLVLLDPFLLSDCRRKIWRFGY